MALKFRQIPKLKCSNIGCDREATVISFETLSSPYCDLHKPGGAESVRDPEIGTIPIKKWLEEICPDRCHPAHVGCWGYPRSTFGISFVHVKVTPCCCGQPHEKDGDGKYIPKHHENSIPKGFCEYCGCEICEKIRREA